MDTSSLMLSINPRCGFPWGLGLNQLTCVLKNIDNINRSDVTEVIVLQDLRHRDYDI